MNGLLQWIVFETRIYLALCATEKIELPSVGKCCLNFRKISLEGKICRRVCKKGSDSIFEKVSANKKFKA